MDEPIAGRARSVHRQFFVGHRSGCRVLEWQARRGDRLPYTSLRDWKTSVLLAKSEVFPVLRFTLGQLLNRSFQSPPTRFVALRISDPVHVFLFVTVTEIFERLSRPYLSLQRRF